MSQTHRHISHMFAFCGPLLVVAVVIDGMCLPHFSCNRTALIADNGQRTKDKGKDATCRRNAAGSNVGQT